MRRSASVIKVGVAYVNVRVLKSLKEELAWAIDKRLRVIMLESGEPQSGGQRLCQH